MTVTGEEILSKGGALGGEVITAGIGFKYKGYLEGLYKAGNRTTKAGIEKIKTKIVPGMKNKVQQLYKKNPLKMFGRKKLGNKNVDVDDGAGKSVASVMKVGKNLTEYADNLLDDVLKTIPKEDLSKAAKKIGVSDDELKDLLRMFKRRHKDVMESMVKIERVDLSDKSSILDANLAIDYTKFKLGKEMKPHEIKRLEKLLSLHGSKNDYRVTDIVAGEIIEGVEFINKGIKLGVKRDSNEYKSLLLLLKEANVGGGKGAKDRIIIADLFFSMGEHRNFFSGDKGIYNKLMKLAGHDPLFYGGNVTSSFPDGFKLTLNGKSIKVFPIDKN